MPRPGPALAGKADATAVEDFAQETVLKVLAGLGTLRGDSKFLTWALAVGTRVVFSELCEARYRDVSLDAIVETRRRAVEPAAPRGVRTACARRSSACSAGSSTRS